MPLSRLRDRSVAWLVPTLLLGGCFFDEKRLAGGTAASSGAGGDGGSGVGQLPPGWPDSATAFCSNGTEPIACGDAAAGDQDGVATDRVAPQYQLVDDNQTVVRDGVTGLLWTAFPAATAVPFSDAGPTCAARASAAFGGASGWRLPTRLELSSVLDLGAIPAITDRIQTDGTVWSRSHVGEDPNQVYVVYFGNGVFARAHVDDANAVLCTAGAGLDERALVLDEATVLDPLTGLMWERNPGVGANDVNWDEARAYCAGISAAAWAGFADWRVPTAKEIATIVDERKTSGALILDGFGWDPSGGQYWTSTPVPGDAQKVFILVSELGTYYDGASSTDGAFLNVRCVRSAS